MQEVLHEQLHDILDGLNSDDGGQHKWSYVGVGRDDGQSEGEYSPIFYREDVWSLQRSETIWLSPTPQVPGSKGWDAANVRILTVADLCHKKSGRVVVAMNTHLDDQGSVSRRNGIKMILATSKEIIGRGEVDGLFLAGDLNSEVDGDAYLELNRTGSGMTDIAEAIRSRLWRYGNELTFTGFNGTGDEEGRKSRIDFIHLGNRSTNRESNGQETTEMPWKVQGYAVLPNRFDDGIYMSDHRAVVGDVVLE